MDGYTASTEGSEEQRGLDAEETQSTAYVSHPAACFFDYRDLLAHSGRQTIAISAADDETRTRRGGSLLEFSRVVLGIHNPYTRSGNDHMVDIGPATRNAAVMDCHNLWERVEPTSNAGLSYRSFQPRRG